MNKPLYASLLQVQHDIWSQPAWHSQTLNSYIYKYAEQIKTLSAMWCASVMCVKYKPNCPYILCLAHVLGWEKNDKTLGGEVAQW